MTYSSHPAWRICRACDGFAAVAVTVAGRDRRGLLRTKAVPCLACRGAGRTPVTSKRQETVRA
nr:hypothetical protein [Streptomyces abyssomicinicus]